MPFGWYVPGTLRKLIATRFQALIAATAQVRSTSSFSEKCPLASANKASGTPAPIRVTASVQASVARYRSVKKGVSRQALSA